MKNLSNLVPCYEEALCQELWKTQEHQLTATLGNYAQPTQKERNLCNNINNSF